MFEKGSSGTSASRLIEEQMYEQVAVELSNGERREGLWAKAYADALGVETTVKALYIKYRVQSIKDEIEIIAEAAKNAEWPDSR